MKNTNRIKQTDKYDGNRCSKAKIVKFIFVYGYEH